MVIRLSHTSTVKQVILSTGLVLLTASGCYFITGYIGYRSVALLLLMVVSLAAILFDIIPVLVAALLSALVWNFFFIPPRFTFHIGSAEDGFLFLMYFIVALINAVLTGRIKRAEKLLREKEEKAKTVKLYNTLLNSLSHELRTPIATIVGAADTLLIGQPALTELNRKELTENISLAALRLNQQVENLLSMSRLESGFIQPRKDWCDINELVYAVLQRLEQPMKNHPVTVSIAENLPLYKVDYGWMEQILYNLLYNAVLYTPEHSPVYITISDEPDKIYTLDTTLPASVKSESHFLHIVVEDRGPGFPEADIEKVFDKFYRLQNSGTGGTGLGLSIVKGFVEAHAGTILLENVPHGARFTIRIPAETSYINNLKNE